MISFAVACFAFSTPVHAVQTVPYKMNFQGRITNISGIALSGTHEMQFKLYTAVTGGTYVWGETRTTANGNAVTVTNGLFNVLIGEGTAVAGSSATLQAAITANTTLFMEVMVGSETLSPRSEFGSAAYAFNSDTIDGIDSAALAQLSTANSFTNTNLITTSHASAFVVNSGSSNLFAVDTTGTGQVVVGTNDANGTVFVLDTKNDNATDPVGTAGAMYYNSTAGKFRCYQAGAWADCITSAGGATLQTAYDSSGTPATITTTAAKGVSIVAGAVPTADIFTVSNVGFATTTANMNGIQVDYVGGAAAVEGSGVRVDLTPGTNTAGTWNGMHVVAAATGATTGVTENGLKLTGPTTPGAGLEVALSIDANWDAGIEIEGKSSEPPTPATGHILVYGQKYAGRTILSQKGSSGVAFAYQPAFFEQSISMLQPGTGTAMTAFGPPWTTDTTGSHPAPSEAYGSHAQYATAGTAADTAGIYQATAQFFRGSVANGSNGFFSVFRIAPSDASYGSGATGARIWVGMSNQTTGLVTADSVAAGHYAGFQYSTNRGDTNWMFLTNNGGAHTAVSTGMTFTPAKVYDMYVYTPPQGTTVYWRIDNVTDGTTQEGSTTTALPGATTALRPGINLATLTTTARKIKVNKVYVEADR